MRARTQRGERETDRQTDRPSVKLALRASVTAAAGIGPDWECDNDKPGWEAGRTWTQPSLLLLLFLPRCLSPDGTESMRLTPEFGQKWSESTTPSAPLHHLRADADTTSGGLIPYAGNGSFDVRQSFRIMPFELC